MLGGGGGGLGRGLRGGRRWLGGRGGRGGGVGRGS